MRAFIPYVFGIVFILGAAFFWTHLPASSQDSGPCAGRKTGRGMTLREIAGQKLHHRDGAFADPWNSGGRRRFLDVLKWKLFSRNEFKHLYRYERVSPVDIDWNPVRRYPGLSVTFITHATVLIRDEDASLLIDPVLDGLFWPIKNFTPLAFDASDMPEPDYVLITHGHYDHLDAGSTKRFGRRSQFITPSGYQELLWKYGAETVHELDWFDSFSDGSREIILLPCSHWTMRNPITGPNTALWGSYLIRTKTGPVIYVSGDLSYFDRFEEVGCEFDIDLAIFNLGAYEPRWFMKHSHINPEETVRAFRELGAKRLMVVHWGTFRLGDEPVYLPRQQIREEMDRAGLSDRLVDLRHGQTLFF